MTGWRPERVAVRVTTVRHGERTITAQPQDLRSAIEQWLRKTGARLGRVYRVDYDQRPELVAVVSLPPTGFRHWSES